jgi:hypothetical protein
MKDKVLNKFSVESNGETIEISTIQTDKGIIVSVNGTTMDIIVNDEVIYSKFDKPEYKDIPVNLRLFIEKNLCEWGNGISKEDGKICCDIACEGEEYWVRMPTNRAKKKDILISNWLNEYEKIGEYDIEIPDAKENYEKLIKDIKSIGYEFRFAWDGNEYDSGYELVVPVNEFNETKVIECFKLWSNYNAHLEEYIKKI